MLLIWEYILVYKEVVSSAGAGWELNDANKLPIYHLPGFFFFLIKQRGLTRHTLGLLSVLL